jgi:hypothetical protein
MSDENREIVSAGTFMLFSIFDYVEERGGALHGS